MGEQKLGADLSFGGSSSREAKKPKRKNTKDAQVQRTKNAETKEKDVPKQEHASLLIVLVGKISAF